mgnify:CR=1 FL=1
MISNVHYIELYIKGQLVELESQDSLNLRINTVLFNPTQTTTKQGEYSYSFDIPSTPINDKILDYANNLSKINKFHARYSAQVYADGSLIFDGSLTVQKYNSKSKMYTCNLVNIKINTLDEIFGDMKMTDLKWMIDFDGASTINSVNSDYSTKYFFPLVSYGVFQKKAVSTDEVGSTYTAKHTLDKYNKWWIESFYPSLNVVETMKKAFESKGYTVGGSAFRDPSISLIYASCNLADEQVPIYNIGNPKFGQASVNFTWNNYRSVNTSNSNFGGRRSRTNSTGGIDQELTFPYEYIRPAINASNRDAEAEYNFDTIMYWNMLDSVTNTAVTVDIQNDTYMYDPNEMVFVIPADGWYRISFQVNSARLSGNGTSFQATQWTTTYYDGDEFKREKVDMTRDISSQQTPLEIQIIRNYSDNIELIKGKVNKIWATGKPLQETYTYEGGGYIGSTVPNLTQWNTDCPHQDPYGAKSPTKTDEMIKQATAARNNALEVYGTGNEYGSTVQHTNSSGSFGGHIGTTRGGGGYSSGGRTFGGRRGTKYNTYGFMHKDCAVMPYDQAVSTAFICGFSSINATDGCGTVAVQRDGYSWSPMSAVKNGVFCNVEGLDLIDISGNTTVTIPTEYCKNTYPNCPSSNYCNVYGDLMYGSINCCVYLNKNDVLEIMAIQRSYEDGQMYACSASCHFDITAISEKTKAQLKADPNWGYYSPTDFPTQLNLFNFTNKETKVSEWINNIKTAFNLEIVQEGNSIEINTNKGIKKNINYAVDIDDRVNSDEATSEYISYPREMSVKYKIDTDEWGFELTIPPEHIDDEGDEWKKWGDSGYTVINLSDDSYETKTQNTSTQFSYTWYDNFLWKDVLQDGTERDWSGLTITIPVISKAEYMAEGYGYDEAMEHDGYSLTQRFWYRDQVSQEYVWLSDHMHEQVFLTYPMNQWEGFNLSYKDTEKSIVTEYFNISPMLSSNYVKIDVHLNPDEYNSIKGGALVHFDSDLYYTSEISGYDPSGNNTTQLKLIKKT